MSIIIDVAEAVKDELNAGSFSAEFTAQRLYQPHYELKDMKVLHVSVVPASTALSLADRKSTRRDEQIHVAVQEKLQTADNDEIDALMDLVQEIADHFHTRRLNAVESAICTEAENAPIYDQEHMEKWRQFTSLLTLTFRVVS